MATLEVHDGRGRVEYVTIAREHPLIFGSDPKCDVVLNDPQILPFHGRLRWKNDRFKAEAFPEARALDLNGKQIVSASFRQGDEIQIGRYRIFLVSEEDGPVDVEKTKVQPRPAAASGDLDWMRGMDVEPPSMEAPVGRRQTARGLQVGSKPSATPSPGAASPPAAVKVAWWRKALRALNAGDRPPGQEKLTSSPLILGLAVILALLLLTGYGLWSVIAKNRADRQYLIAEEDLENREFRNALQAFDEFLETNPRDPRVGKARVLRELANVRQFTASGGVSWTTAIDAAKEMIEKVGDEPAYADARMFLAEEILKAAEGLADVARTRADAKTLAESEAAVALHEKVAGPAAKTLLKKSLLPGKLEEAHAAVTKAQIRKDALAKMADAVKKGSAADVFATRDALVAQYPDLADDKEVVAGLTGANDLVRKAVSFDPTRRPAETTPHPDPLGPPVSLVLRSSAPGTSPEPATSDGAIVYALAQGYLYGVDGAVGAPLWHVPVGLSTPFSPLPIAGSNPSVLIFDARHDELVRLDGRTGRLLWRQATGEPVTSPPLVMGNRIVQNTPSGKMLLIDLPSGELRGTLDVGKPLSGTPASDETGEHLYLTADRDSVFVISRDPTECVSVAYLGHRPGSIRCAPARLADFLIVPENTELWEGKWSVFVIEEDGARLRFVQSVKIPGWTWQTPESQGSIVWSLTDRGAVTAFSMGPVESKEPLTMIASTVPDARPSGPAFARARGDRELWISSSRLARFDLDTERGLLSPAWTIERAGPSLGPIQTAGRLAVLTHQFTEGPGITLWGVDPSNGKVAWRTILGAPWPLSPAPSADAQELVTLATDGKPVHFSKELLAKGGFLEQPLRRPGYFYLPKGPLLSLETDGLSVLVPAPDADHLLVREDPQAEFRRVDLPAVLGAWPVFWGTDLFVPGIDGRAYLVDPKTGASRAEPYVPVFDASKPTRWKRPVFLSSDAVVLADESGTVRRLNRLTEPRVRLDVVGDVVDLKSPFETDPASTGDAVILATADGRVRSLAGRDLSPLGAWTLEVPRALGPLSVGKHAIVVDKAGGVLFFGPDGSRVWSADLRDAPPVGPPVIKGDAVWFLSRDGALQKRALADGAPLDRIDLGILPAGGLWAVGSDLIVSAAPGTLRLLLPSASAGTSP